MPKKVENKLKREAKKKGLSPKRTNAYVYGTMQKLRLLETGGNREKSRRQGPSKKRS